MIAARVVQCPGQLGRLDFSEGNALRILDDVPDRRLKPRFRIEFYESFVLKKHKCARLVRRIVGQRDHRTCGDVLELLVFPRIEPQRRDEDLSRRFQLKFAVCAEIVQIRQMLKEVRVELLLRQKNIRRHIVRELDDLQFDALRLEVGLDELKQVSVRDGRGPDLQGHQFPCLCEGASESHRHHKKQNDSEPDRRPCGVPRACAFLRIADHRIFHTLLQ